MCVCVCVYICVYIYVYILLIIGDLNAKVGSQGILRVTGKFGLKD